MFRLDYPKFHGVRDILVQAIARVWRVAVGSRVRIPCETDWMPITYQ
jgi:hypothetical protein